MLCWDRAQTDSGQREHCSPLHSPQLAVRLSPVPRSAETRLVSLAGVLGGRAIACRRSGASGKQAGSSTPQSTLRRDRPQSVPARSPLSARETARISRSQPLAVPPVARAARLLSRRETQQQQRQRQRQRGVLATKCQPLCMHGCMMAHSVSRRQPAAEYTVPKAAAARAAAGRVHAGDEAAG